MLDIILLYFLTKNMGALAIQKGLPAGKWKLNTIFAWLGFETLGLFIGVAFWGMGNLFGLMLFCLACAFGGYLTVRYILENKPDEKIDDDINRIGVDQLKP